MSVKYIAIRYSAMIYGFGCNDLLESERELDLSSVPWQHNSARSGDDRIPGRLQSTELAGEWHSPSKSLCIPIPQARIQGALQCSVLCHRVDPDHL